MTQDAFDLFKSFDFDQADVFLWVFKTSRVKDSKYTAHHVLIDETLSETLKDFVKSERERITEYHPYGHLAQINESGCLSVSVDETNFQLLKDLVDRPETNHTVQGTKELRRAVGYCVKFVHHGQVVYATRRSPNTWRTAYKKKNVLFMNFVNGGLEAIEGEEFTLDPRFDMFCIGTGILVANKGGFESMMQYRSGYVQAFNHLRTQPEFVALFTDMQPLIDHVGTNAIHLRRMAVIQEKALYADAAFISALKTVAQKYSWAIQFDSSNKIIPTPDTAALIMKLLLDQRLVSEVTHIMYDVPDAVRVQ
ncbi:Kiwa anti-phage protein KwaB-like domain-containing protein [Xanthomonas euvesicatoria]